MRYSQRAIVPPLNPINLTFSGLPPAATRSSQNASGSPTEKSIPSVLR